jgi:hypothetical protein
MDAGTKVKQALLETVPAVLPCSLAGRRLQARLQAAGFLLRKVWFVDVRSLSKNPCCSCIAPSHRQPQSRGDSAQLQYHAMHRTHTVHLRSRARPLKYISAAGLVAVFSLVHAGPRSRFTFPPLKSSLSGAFRLHAAATGTSCRCDKSVLMLPS